VKQLYRGGGRESIVMWSIKMKMLDRKEVETTVMVLVKYLCGCRAKLEPVHASCTPCLGMKQRLSVCGGIQGG
jgi:hypothetical protein